MIIVSRSQSSSNGHVQTDRCVRQTCTCTCVIHETSQEWKGAHRQTQTLLETPHRRQEASSTASSQEHLDYVVLVATANVLDLSDDCLRRMLQFSECKRAFLAIACVCWQFRKLVTRAVIDEWSLSAFGLQDASRSLASACKVMRIERQANVEKRSHIFLPYRIFAGVEVAEPWQRCHGSAISSRAKNRQAGEKRRHKLRREPLGPRGGA